MLLIDALHIHIGGGKSLLNALIKAFREQSEPVFWLLDERAEGALSIDMPNHTVVYKKANLLTRWIFYRSNKAKFSKVLCLGNIPPPIRLNIPVYTYFHTTYLIANLPFLSVKRKVITYLKKKVLLTLKNNTNYWIVQTEEMQSMLSLVMNITQKYIHIIPIIDEFFRDRRIEKEEYLYIYIGLDTPHKNHIRLIDAFCDFFEQTRKGRLVITVPDNSKLIGLIEKRMKSGYPIENAGVLDREQLHRLYNAATYHIYPSLTESFGLSIIESIQCGSKVIGADLPYMYEICNPSIAFDPFDTTSITKALSRSFTSDTPETKCLVANKVDQLREMLTLST